MIHNRDIGHIVGRKRAKSRSRQSHEDARWLLRHAFRRADPSTERRTIDTVLQIVGKVRRPDASEESETPRPRSNKTDRGLDPRSVEYRVPDAKIVGSNIKFCGGRNGQPINWRRQAHRPAHRTAGRDSAGCRGALLHGRHAEAQQRPSRSLIARSMPMRRTRRSDPGTTCQTGPRMLPATRWWRRWTKLASTGRSTSRHFRCTNTMAAMR